MLNFDFLEKGLEKVSPSHFLYDFSRKIFFMLYSIYQMIKNTSWDIGKYVDCNCWFPFSDVINFEVKFIFLTVRSSTRPKSQDKNLNLLRTERDFKVKQKLFFIILKSIQPTFVSDWREEWPFMMHSWPKLVLKNFRKLPRISCTEFLLSVEVV